VSRVSCVFPQHVQKQRKKLSKKEEYQSPKDSSKRGYSSKRNIHANLFRAELPNYWRMLYTLTGDETKIEIIAFVLDLVDHSTYNKKFSYKKK
jgi:hypothetical protein